MRTIQEMSNLNGQRVLLTGGAGHIGLAAAETLVELGARVAILDKEAACRARVEELNQGRANCAVPIPCDLEDELSTREAGRQAIRELGGLDSLIHCAAFVG